jgi:hypothetical protein
VCHTCVASEICRADWLGSVALFETDRIAQSGHRFLENAILDGARGHKRGERLGDDVELLLRGLGAAAPGVLQQS